MIEIGFGDIGLSKWSMDYTRMPECSLRVLGDTATAHPRAHRSSAASAIARKPAASPSASPSARRRRSRRATMRCSPNGRAQSREDWDASPITLPRLAHEVWDVIKDEDWVLTASTLQDWTLKLWDFDKPYRHAGRALGTGTQIGVSLGVALAHRGTGRLVVDIQPDGDLMFDAGALWTAAKNNIAVAHRDVQQPRLLQRLGAPDPRRRAPRHAGRARPYRPGHRRAGARFRDAGALMRLVRRRADRSARRTSPPRSSAPSPR